MLHVALQVFYRDNLHRGGSLLIKCFAMCFFFNKTDFLFRPIKVSVVFATSKASLKQWLVRVKATYVLVARFR